MNKVFDGSQLNKKDHDSKASKVGPVIENLKLTVCLSLVATSLVGCAHRGGIFGVDCCADVPAGAVPEPPGTKVCHLLQTQISAAKSDQNALYRADFIGLSTELSPDAMDRLARQNANGSLGLDTLIVEPSGDEDLDQRRLVSVGNKLAEFGIVNVHLELATPAALGLSGQFAEDSLLGGRPSTRTINGNSGFGGMNVFGGSF